MSGPRSASPASPSPASGTSRTATSPPTSTASASGRNTPPAPGVVGGGYAHQDFDAAPDTDFVHVGGSYALAPGVTACAAVQWGEGRAAGDGVAVYTWLGLVF